MRLDKLYKRNSDPELFFEEPGETNCGSFALNVIEWYTPYITDDSVDEDDELYQYAEWERANHAYELAQEGYTAEDYISDCEGNADDEYCKMLARGKVTLIPIED